MNVASISREFKELPMSLIDEPTLASRSAMDDEKMVELVASIRAIGLIQPMSVARVGARFEVIAGHRRCIACRLAGLVSAPCIIYPSREDALDAIQFAENRHREDLSAADEAIWFSELLEKKCGGDIEQLCGLVGEKETYVNNRLLLFSGDPEVFAALQRGVIKIGVAHELNKCPDQKYRRYYLDCAIRGGATVALVVGWITEWKTLFGGPQPPTSDAAPSEQGIPDVPHNPFTCEICRRADNVHLIRQINVHQHCKMAILDPLLATYRGEA
ncbi:MAG TPA: ParB/RepB/Spo0J family partition protein [Vicinamibacterales bacterium]|jgi:ParB family chromosome partitioning protein|nr:ParB/RepB/Spo0J family partition protein [Vicinamibacterales bacterium]